MAEVELQEQLTMAEPRECSRWVMTCVLGSTSVSLLCISLFLVRKSASDAELAIGVPLVFLAFFLCGLFGIVLIEWCSGRIYPEGQTFVDKLLSL